MTFTASPTTLNPGDTSSLTAGITQNNLGTTGFTVPSGIPTVQPLNVPVTFAGTKGTVNPTMPNLTTASTATSTYTPNTGASGSASVSATIDGQTLSVPLTLTLPSQADVKVTKTGPMTAIAGNQIVYTITVSNVGGVDASNVVLSDTLPAGTTFVSQSQGTGTHFSLSHSGTTITDTAATLKAGASQTFTVTAQIKPDTPAEMLSNTATATTDTTDPNLPTNGTSTATTTVTTQADLVVSKTGPPSAVAGNQVVYTITLTNNGPSDAQNVTLSDPLPSGTKFVSQSQGTGTHFSLSQSGGTITDTASTLKAGASQTFTVTAQIKSDTPASTLSNTATVTTDTTDPNLPTNGTSTAMTTVTTQADLVVVKTGTPAAIAGNQVVYTITLTNNGPSDAQNVTLTDPLPTGTAFVSQSQGTGTHFMLSHSGGTITDTAATLKAGDSQTFMVTAQVKSDTPASTLSNTATATTDTTDPNLPTNGTSTAMTSVTTQADVVVTKTGPTTAIAGNEIVYTVVVANNGPSDAQNVVLSDPLPAGTTFVSQSQSGGNHFDLTHSGTTITDTASTLKAGGSQTIIVTAQIKSDTPASTLSNTATATTDTTDPNLPTNGTSTARPRSTTQADVVVTKTGPAAASPATRSSTPSPSQTTG